MVEDGRIWHDGTWSAVCCAFLGVWLLSRLEGRPQGPWRGGRSNPGVPDWSPQGLKSHPDNGEGPIRAERPW